MKKTALFLVVMLVLSVFALSSCELLEKIPGIENIPGIGDLFNKPCEEHVDADGNYICDNCEAELEKNDTPDTPCEHKDDDKDHKCDACGEATSECKAAEGSHNCAICGTKLSECAAADGSHNCAVCGTKLSECAAADGSHNCAICGTKLTECAAAENSHTCELCGAKISDCTDADSDWVCDICGGEALPENMERVNYSLNISDLTAGTGSADAIHGKFTIVAGTEIRNRTKTYEGVEYNKSVKMAAGAINVDVPGTGKLRFIVQNGSSGAAVQYVKITDPKGTVSEVEIPGTDGGSPLYLVELDVTPGTWSIQRVSGTIDVYYLDLSCIVEKADENGFELVAEGTVDYLCGQKLDLSGIRLNSTFANGKTEPLALEDVTVDDSLVNLGQSGTYALTLKYKDYEPISININVYLPVSVELDFDGTVQGPQSAAGNGTYVNQSFKEVYKVGEELDITGLFVSVVGSLGEGNTKTFANVSDYAYSYNELVVGANTITVKYIFGAEEISTTTTVYVVDTAPSIVEDVYQVKVDADYKGVIGAVEGGYNMFTTVQQALDFLANSEAAKSKVMIIEEGLYTEKLEITIPNLYIKGVGADKVIIEWDSIYGIKDAGGYAQVTDSTQTVAIRDTATGVTIEGVTISNYWNSQERMDAAGLEIERGLALLVQADRFVMKNSKLLGIQDTLELFTGRQYFENVFISGYTDFIFGTNNTTLFKNCTIHVIDTAKDDNGTAGYITAFKGSNKGAQDSVVYGAIFDHCKFTADEGVMEGKTAIGRTWGAYAAVAIINSEIGGHISLDGYDSSENKNKRYISMNGIHPTDSTVQFVEYNNTGAGAITEAVAGMRLLTAEEAAKYADFKVIFGTANGNVSYLDPWDPMSTEIVVDDRTYYYFDGTTGGSGTVNTFDTSTTIDNGTTYEWAGLVISAENGRVAWNANANKLNMKAGAFIKFNVSAGSTVTVVTHSGYGYYTINGAATSHSTTFTKYFAEDTEVTIMSTGDLYVQYIVINPGEEAPEAPTLNEIKVNGMNVNYVVGDELSLEGVEVKAYYSDNSVVAITDYTVDSSAVNKAAAGSYDVVFSYGGKSAEVTVNYEDPNAAAEITKNTYLDFSNVDGYNAVVSNDRITLDGSFRANGSEYQIKGTISFPVKAGTIVTVIPYGNSTYVSYTIGEEGEAELTTLNEKTTVFFDKDCTVVYTGLDNNYLVGIQIICPLADGTYVFGGKQMDGDFTGILSSVENLVIEGTCKTHSGGAQLASDSVITFTVAPYTTVDIQGFDTNYGQLEVLVNGRKIEMDGTAHYVFSTEEAAIVTIKAVNVGTEEAPAWNQSYITAITVEGPFTIAEDATISFGSEGNYKDSGIDFSGIEIRDNGGNNSQIKNGSFSFFVKAGAVVTVKGYPNYTSYSFNDSDEITDADYVFTAVVDTLINITPVKGDNYFYSITVSYPVKESFSVTFGSEGNYKDSGIDFSGIEIRDNGGNNSQIKNGSFSFKVYAGATVTVNGYPNYTSYSFNGSEEITDTTYVFTATEDGDITITPVNGNNYFYSIDVAY